MKTLARAQALADAVRGLCDLYPPSCDDLLEAVRCELGHAEILDGFQPYAGHFSRAVAVESILHIVSGNTPHAALQSVLRGLLVGANNFVKLPSCGLAEISAIQKKLPAELADKLIFSCDLIPEWLEDCTTWIVYGDDATIAHFRDLCPATKRFIPHGHRLSLGLVFQDTTFASCSHAARDASLFEQQGCLSPHAFYVAENARDYAAALAQEMDAYCLAHPPKDWPLAVQARIADIRADYAFRAASDPKIQVWQSPGSTSWTVILTNEFHPPQAIGYRVVFVLPLPGNILVALSPHAAHLGAIGIWPATIPLADSLARSGASRICRIGKMQDAPFSWHAEGQPNLAQLVHWIDFQP